jgi:cytidyltransferase-like protein
MANKKDRWVAVSGGFDPIHIGHVRMFKEARRLGDKLVVILNNDNWLRSKKGYAFMPEAERKEVIESFPYVDKVVLTDHREGDADMSVSRTLKQIQPAVFANGGDRVQKNTPEDSVCLELGIQRKYGVGKGGKVQSSSWMIAKASRPIKKTSRPWGEYYGWDQGANWNLKTIYIKPKSRLSLQYHHRRTECWLLVEGDATATVHDSRGKATKVPLKKGVTYCIGKKQVHRLESKKGGIVVEVAYGAFDEEDIVRIEDDHGRPTSKKRS